VSFLLFGLGVAAQAPLLAQAEGEGGGLSIDLFWIILSSGNFIILMLYVIVLVMMPASVIVFSFFCHFRVPF